MPYPPPEDTPSPEPTMVYVCATHTQLVDDTYVVKRASYLCAYVWAPYDQ